MPFLKYNLKTDWVFYLFVASYAFLVTRMTFGLASAEGINIFTSYSSAQDLAQLLEDANKVYWSKSCFLFVTLFLTALNLDFRMAVGIAGAFWSLSLLIMFGPTFNLIAVLIGAVVLLTQQIARGEIRNRVLAASQVSD